MCDAFIKKEYELWKKNPRVVKDIIFYSKPTSNQYEIFWVKFIEDFFQ
jgi:hypothetical protein